jgi:hypothetical protein
MEVVDATKISPNNAKGKGKVGRGSVIGPSHQRNPNWTQEEVLALINYKQKEHIYFKHLVNPRVNMVLTP